MRPVPEPALHVTLVFLGWQEEGQAAAIAEAAFAARPAAAAPVLAPLRAVAVPPRGPRLFALELDDAEGRAGELQCALSDSLESGGWYRPERRLFWPHLTLARVRKGARRVRLPAGPGPPTSPFEAEQITLYRSILRPEGALYEPLARAGAGR